MRLAETAADALFRIEPHSYSESGKRIALSGTVDLRSALTPEEIAIIDFIADEYGHIAPEQLGYLTKRLNTEMPPETWGTNQLAAINEDAFLRLGPAVAKSLRKVISEQDLDDRSRWSEPIDDDPLTALTRALNG